jgi:hypothetical protein
MPAYRKPLIGLFAFAAVLLAVVAVVPALREKVQFMFAPIGNEVLATVEGDLLNDGSQVKAVKYRSSQGIFVEVHRTGGTGSTLIDRILLPDKHDGLFNYNNQVTRLASADIDGDSKLELLAPSFDNQLVPHLNVFHYNPATQRFELYTPQTGSTTN